MYEQKLRWQSPNPRARPVDIETSAYALLYLAEKNDLSQGMKIVNWLVSQRNPNGGFSSTQVSLLIFPHQYFFAFESNTKFISTLNQVNLPYFYVNPFYFVIQFYKNHYILSSL